MCSVDKTAKPLVYINPKSLSRAYKPTPAVPSNSLRELRNAAIKAGNFKLAQAIKDAQALRKKGLNASVQAKLATWGLQDSSATAYSRFPQERQLANVQYRSEFGQFEKDPAEIAPHLDTLGEKRFSQMVKSGEVKLA